MKKLNLVFMATAGFAMPALDKLKHSPHCLSGLVTQPDRPQGRGQKLKISPLKAWALKNEVELFQPASLHEPAFLAWLEAKTPDLIITAAYGKLLTATLLNQAPLGAINLHASYLPAYRGAAPIHRAVIDGAVFSGVSVIQMTSELDAGAVLMQEKEEISFCDTAGTLHDRLAQKGAALLIKTVEALAGGRAVKTEQNHHLATYAAPLSAADERLNWADSALSLYNRIRGLNPWPGAYTLLCGKRLKIWEAAIVEEGTARAKKLPGTILTVGEHSLTVATGRGVLSLKNLQPAGKKTMDVGSFCCGYRLMPGQVLGGAD